MKYLIKPLAVLSLGILIYSCNKREIIPPPERKVELKNHFIGKINGSDIELTLNVNGYSGTSGVDLIINASTLDSAVYYSSFKSTQTPQAITVGHGSLIFDWGASERPTLATFESFYMSGLNLTPVLSGSGLNGFMVTYTDGTGKEFKSNTVGNVTYATMAIESDSSGDYAKFKVGFDAEVSRTYFDVDAGMDVTDYIMITNAVYTGWYKR